MEMTTYNKWLCMLQGIIVSAVVGGWLLMEPVEKGIIESGSYNPIYIAFWLFQFTVVTMAAVLLDTRDLQLGGAKKRLAVLSLIFLIHIPAIGSASVVCQVSMGCLWKSLLIEILWVAWILKIQDWLRYRVKEKPMIYGWMLCFLGAYCVLPALALWGYVAKQRLVITTVFDNDIPKGFYMNPPFVLSGWAHVATGGKNYAGQWPVLWSVVPLVVGIVAVTWLIRRENVDVGSCHHGETLSH